MAIVAILAVLAGVQIGRVRGGCFDLGQDIPIDPQRVAEANVLIDPNTASAASLRRLPRVGKITAGAIVEWRRANGGPDGRPFKTLSDLDRVPRIGPGTLGHIQAYLTLGSGVEPK